jgi:myo-inositol 2-dehydrogenase / D-chiro-inositol 1-dehydrogenase
VAAAAIGFPYIVPRHVLGGPGYTPPSEKFTKAHIGVGGRGNALMGEKDPMVLAVCDVDEKHLAYTLTRATPQCKGYRDYREVLDRKDIDAVVIATPPHWHALISIHAAQAGKDIYCEKPMTRFIHEGRAVVDAVKRYGRVFQIGTDGRFKAGKLRKLVQSGILGSPITVRLDPPYDFKVKEWSGRTDLTPQPVPPQLHWDMWLGPAPDKPYHPDRCHAKFRGYWDYDGGGYTDMAAHYMDPVQYIIDADDTGPVEIEAEALWPSHPDAVGLWGTIRCKYENGTTVICRSDEWGPDVVQGEPFIEGPKGKVFHGYRYDPPDLLEKIASLPDPEPLVGFETAVRTRRQAGGNAEVAHRVATFLHLGNIAIRTGRRLRWDPVTEQVLNDEEANRLVNVPMRAPWHLPL